VLAERNFLTWPVIGRPLAGEAPSSDLVLGYHKANKSPLLRLLVSRAEALMGRVLKDRSQNDDPAVTKLKG
jgi:LysR family hca operon transcriptional activator